MALVDIYNAWRGESGALKAKFVGACLKAAYDILNEDAGTANHANRVVWANVIVAGTMAEAEEKALQHLRYAVASNATIQAAGNDSADNDVQFVVNSQIDTFATGA